MRFLILLFMLAFSTAVNAQIKKGNHFDGSSGDESDLCLTNAGRYMSEKEVNDLVTNLLGKIGTRNRYIIVSCPLVDNCLAILYKGKPYILYNPEFLGRVKKLSFTSAELPTVTNKDWETLAILAHELGHHVNNHLSNPLPEATQRDMELEADETAGFLIYLLGGKLTQAQIAYREMPAEGTYTHPGKTKRLEAVERGWNDARAKYPGLQGEKPTPTPVKPSPEPLPGMVYVEGGAFSMGSSSKKDEQPVHSVTVSSFYMGKYEVTVAEYRTFCLASGRAMPEPPSWGWINTHPMVNVSWDDAVAYCAWLSKKTGKTYRLPTEAEWEYAARGGNQSRGYAYSGDNTIDPVAWYKGNSGDQTQSVGSKKPNEIGLYDMSGNVVEWCHDWYGDYPATVQTNPKGPANGSDRVLRGGDWLSSTVFCRASFRSFRGPEYHFFNFGFRVVCSE